ncbi:MAG: type II toxin-antitoxin system RelE/ParE family toxin [Burkholderiales bacterium]|jgi:proteic killer suppression protein|nr:type II toxin-antitoxin system RelE/ParE family toxin [Burkholderiales bacterium]
MIRTFRDRDTESLFEGRCPTRWRSIRSAAERKLQMLDSAADVADLRAPPGNRLEKLAGDRQGQYSIRINDQWRICFRWAEGGAWDVQIVDYH